MLNSLEVLNGEMSLKFDSLNTIYTVVVDSKQDSLNLKYDCSDDYKVSIFGNVLDDTNNEVVISVYNDFEVMSYYLEVYKEPEVQNVFLGDNEGVSLEVKKEMPIYIAPSIASVCFLFILLFFTLLFKKSKKTKIKNWK